LTFNFPHDIICENAYDREGVYMKQGEEHIGKGLYILPENMEPKEKKRGIFWFVWFLICGLMMVWPVYQVLGNRIYPFVLGLPFCFFWIILSVVLIFLGAFIKFSQEYKKIGSRK
jgi:hypothetical protein